MKLTQGTYIFVMAMLQNHLDLAKRDKNHKKEKKVLQAIQELDTIGVY